MTASFPSGVWDGTTRQRQNFSVSRGPDGYDFDRISEEVKATQRYLATQLGVPMFFNWYSQVNQRFGELQANGGLTTLSTGDALSSGTPINVTKNASRVMIVINAGSDVTGSITVTGDKVNRNTGIVSVGATEVIPVAGLTTDDTDDTSLGTHRHQFTRAYISEEWFQGSVALSTTDLTLTDVDTYSISYEEYSDLGHLEFDILDVSAIPTNVNAALDVLLFKVTWDPTTKQSNITIIGEMNVPATDVSAANQFMRIRRALGDEAHLDYDERDGWFLNVGFYPDNQTYWSDFTLKLWGYLYFPLRLATLD
jgi:hypothetical protein